MSLDQLFCGDKNAWEAFVRKVSPTVWAAINKTFIQYSFHARREEVEDVYCSIFLSLLEDNYRKLKQFNSSASCAITTFLTIISVRKTIDHIRKENSMRLIRDIPENDLCRILEEFPDERVDAVALLAEETRMVQYQKAIRSLSENEKQMYGYIFEKELSPEEIATLLDITLPAMYLRKHRLVEKIKKSVKEMDGTYV